ncbi:hypothetical protein MKW92_015514 [Papaver armeniacum]|nr:hypothetical protein MKW92_015514 [Papaver armeniacum]
MDGGVSAIASILRTFVDCIHLFHLWFQFRLPYVSRQSLVVGGGQLVWDARAIACHYVRSLRGLFFDIFVILPVPQIVFGLLVPKMIKEEEITVIMTVLLVMFLCQFLPKVYHVVYLIRRMKKVNGYVFGTIWWAFGINLTTYLVASHVAGGCWYVLGIQRVASCLKLQCERTVNCNLPLACSNEVCSRFPLPDMISCANNTITHAYPSVPFCLKGNGPVRYGIFKLALPVVSSNSLVVRILYPIYWGLMNLSTFGNNLGPTSQLLRDPKEAVPLFHNLDDLVLDNLCDRVNPLTFTTNEKVTRDGNPLHRMIFIMRGRLESSRKLSNGMVVTTCTLGPGNFVGDELLSWCLRRPLVDRLPASSVTFVCAEETEAFGLDANDLLYMTDRFRYKFANERLIRKTKYYSSSWRTWGALGIQIAWNRHRLKTRGHPAAIQETENGDTSECALMKFASMFLSRRPHDHLE